jgi:alpha-tubulin suppressor-like RCC1 family protein
MAIKSDGTLWGWGYNDDGQLGTNDTTYYSSPVQIGNANNWDKVATSYRHSAAIKKDGSLYVWGQNSYGQLGQNNTSYTSSPVQVDGSWDDVSCGDYHTVALRGDGTVWCFGANWNGQLGDNQLMTDHPQLKLMLKRRVG